MDLQGKIFSAKRYKIFRKWCFLRKYWHFCISEGNFVQILLNMAILHQFRYKNYSFSNLNKTFQIFLETVGNFSKNFLELKTANFENSGKFVKM